MKIWFYIFSFALLARARAQVQTQWTPVRTDFWQSTAPKQVALRLRELTPGLQDDCEQFRREYQSRSDWTATEFDLLRTIPLKNSMRDHYEADFEILSNMQSYKNLPPLEPLQLSEHFEANPHIYVETSSMSDLRAVGDAELMQISKQLGLKLEPARLVVNTGEQKSRVRFFSREMLCDFLSSKVVLSAQAEAELSLSGEMIERLNRFYEKIEKIYELMMAEETSTDVKAIKLGAAFGQMVRDKSDEANYEFQLGLLYDRVFSLEGLSRSEYWQNFGGYNLLVFAKDSPIKQMDVILRGEK